jgi:predicted lipoprotein with Yx(FWY)xxD motif
VGVIAIVVLAIVVLSVWGSSQSTATAPVNTAPEAPAVTGAATTGLSVPAGKELTTLQVAENDELGPILTDGEGMSLYILDADQGGESTCYDACAEAWPPAVLVSDPEVGEEVNTTLIRVIERTDGKTQLTYNGYPLYYYWEDEAPGDVKGHQIASPLGLWTAISPDGETAGK